MSGLLVLLSLMGLGMMGSAMAPVGESASSDEEEDQRLIAGEAGGEISAEDGDDTLIGSAAADILDGGAGNDVLIGSVETEQDIADFDELRSTPDLNDANMDALREVLSSNPDGSDDGDDVYIGGTGNDLLYDGYSDAMDYDLLQGGDGDDHLFDFDGAATLEGGAGNDVLVSVEGYAVGEGKDDDGNNHDNNPAADMLRGGDGDDYLMGDDADTMQGGDGIDTFRVYIDSLYSDNGQSLVTDDMTYIEDWEEGEQIIIDYDPFHNLDGDYTEAELETMQAAHEDTEFRIWQEEEGVSIHYYIPPADGEDTGTYMPVLFIQHVTISEVQPYLTIRQFVEGELWDLQQAA